MGFWLLAAAAVYFAPAFIGYGKKGFHRIALINLFAGWTIIGWGLALVAALKAEEKDFTKVPPDDDSSS